MIEQKVNAKAELFSSMLQFQAGIFQNALKDLTEELALVRPSGRSNHINWLLGHILHCRYMLANMLEADAENPFGNTYWTAIEDKEYPSVEAVVSQLPIVSEKLLEKLSEMEESALVRVISPGRPALADIVSFFIYHEAYHLGQIGYARKLVGMEAMQSH